MSQRSNPRPLRVLHVLGELNRGGVEHWLMHLLRRANRDEIAMDFLVHSARPALYDAEARALGARIISCPSPRRLWSYAPAFRAALKKNGPYDVIHSHVHFYSGFPLWLAARAGIPVRIAHSHTSGDDGRVGVARRAYYAAMRRLLQRHATSWLSGSTVAATSLFGPAWREDARSRILRCGIDLEPFGAPASARLQLGLSPDDLVIGHLGSFTPAKNHRFFVEVAGELSKLAPKSRFVLLGDGALRPQIERQVDRAGLRARFVFAGNFAGNMADALMSMDAFLFPSLREGLPLALLEAQAAGLSCLVSEGVTREAAVVPEAVRWLSLDRPAREWADALVTAAQSTDKRRRAETLARMRRSEFNIENNLRDLIAHYQEQAREQSQWN